VLAGEGFILTHSAKDWIFVSDAHFSGEDPEAMEAFLRFLNVEKDRMSHLVILGDLFEFLFGFKKKPSNGKAFPFRDYLPVLKGLHSLYRQGIRIKYFEGNHDFFLRSFFLERFGMEVEVFSEGNEERIGEKRAFIAHGDLFNPKLWRYRIWRRMIKNRWTYDLIERVGPRFSCRVAKWLSQKSYQRNHARLPSGPPPEFKKFAHQKFLDGFDIVILGHSHVPEEAEERVDGKRCLYFNVGDWMEHRSFLRFTPPDRFELGRWKEEGLGDEAIGR
jgi:UDP-2,3-diacylglucosamine hydrolase